MGHNGHSGRCKDTERNNTHPAIHFPIKQEPQTRGLERYGSSSLAPSTPQTSISMENGQEEVQPGIPPGRTWSKLPEDFCQRDRLQRPHGNHQRLEYPQEVQTPGGEDKHAREKTRPLWPEEERVRPNYTEAVIFGEKSVQETEVGVNRSRISSSINRKITPTQIEHNVVTPENNLNSDALWLQMSQYAQQTQKQSAELDASHERMKILTASMDKIVKNLQEVHAQ
ncbi:hypothetical protein O181_085750 [Austropuccinia psidii MF-1]|uniref:Uncharacterized protein n=1 Tax=Austropuccinia psidii MF-1 TaxID=1389203 RepID=A0A9Q3FY48_9BASI|nr:hypothetical protein [Austropuccinia psidii MF-1]